MNGSQYGEIESVNLLFLLLRDEPASTEFTVCRINTSEVCGMGTNTQTFPVLLSAPEIQQRLPTERCIQEGVEIQEMVRMAFQMRARNTEPPEILTKIWNTLGSQFHLKRRVIKYL
jgi:hypothetical protein